MMLKREGIQNGADLKLSGSGMQFSSTDLAGLTLPPQKRSRLEDDEVIFDDEVENNDTLQGPLVLISQVATAFLEAAFCMKLDNNALRVKAKADGIPDSHWIQCAKLDSVVSANVLVATRETDRASSQIQNFWLDAVNPLIFLLEKAGATSRSHC